MLKLQPVTDQMVESSDLAGPVCIALCLGFLLLLGGKLHFSDIESSFVVGSLALYLLFNFMAKVLSSHPERGCFPLHSDVFSGLLPAAHAGAGFLRSVHPPHYTLRGTAEPAAGGVVRGIVGQPDCGGDDAPALVAGGLPPLPFLPEFRPHHHLLITCVYIVINMLGKASMVLFVHCIFSTLRWRTYLQANQEPFFLPLDVQLSPSRLPWR